MPLFSSTTPLRGRAVRLVDNYGSYVDGPLGDALDHTTDTVAVQLRAARGNTEAREGLGAFLAEAISIHGDADFKTLPAPLQDDVTKIVEEVPLAQKHIDTVTNPDTLFADLAAERKHELTERATVHPNNIGALRDILHFTTRANRGGSPDVQVKP